jgi:hypothetical protein
MKRQSRRKNNRKKFVGNIMNFVSEHVFKKDQAIRECHSLAAIFGAKK